MSNAAPANHAPSWPGIAHLPAESTSFVGRERELAQATAMVRRADVRLLVMTGPGGIGKTRLATQVATTVGDAFADGGCFVDLAPLRDPTLVLPTIASALEVRESGQEPLERLTAHLRGRQRLLVLDNFEPVVGAAPAVAELLKTCPQLKILATSRKTLQISWERDFPVPSLAVPAVDERLAVERATDYGAVRLFLERAKAVNPAFALTVENLPAVVEICRRLDGLPLAIELAAARVRLLAPADLLAQLVSRLPLLTGGPRDAPARLRTMRDALAWSYDLLSEEEQALFRRLSVFVGGFTLEAAAAVTMPRAERLDWWQPGQGFGFLLRDVPPAAPREPNPVTPAVLDGLAALVDQSLLRQATSRHGSRFAMLETIREFGLERLAAAGETESIRNAHTAHFLAINHGIGVRLWGPEQPILLDQVEIELDNLRAVFAWADERGMTEISLALGAGLWVFWWTRGHVTEGRRWLEPALAAGDAPAPARAEALMVAGFLAWMQGDDSHSHPMLVEALTMYRAEAHRPGIARSLLFLALVAWHRGEIPRMVGLTEEALVLFRADGDLGGQPSCLIVLAIVARLTGEPDRAVALLDEAFAIAASAGAVWFAAAAGYYRGEIHAERGDVRRAAASFQQSLEPAWALGDKWGAGACIGGLATIAAARGEPVRAARLFAAADALCEMAGAVLPTMDRDSYDRVRAGVRAALGAPAFDAATAEGRLMPPTQAVAEAVAVARAASGATAMRPPTAAAALTPREHDVVRLLAEGRTNKEIASVLGISAKTVNGYVASILDKLGLPTRAAAAAYAIRHDLV